MGPLLAGSFPSGIRLRYFDNFSVLDIPFGGKHAKESDVACNLPMISVTETMCGVFATAECQEQDPWQAIEAGCNFSPRRLS
jgi:hypothetical protein